MEKVPFALPEPPESPGVFVPPVDDEVTPVWFSKLFLGRVPAGVLADHPVCVNTLPDVTVTPRETSQARNEIKGNSLKTGGFIDFVKSTKFRE